MSFAHPRRAPSEAFSRDIIMRLRRSLLRRENVK
jgi:hypothetical protein